MPTTTALWGRWNSDLSPMPTVKPRWARVGAAATQRKMTRQAASLRTLRYLMTSPSKGMATREAPLVGMYDHQGKVHFGGCPNIVEGGRFLTYNEIISAPSTAKGCFCLG